MTAETSPAAALAAALAGHRGDDDTQVAFGVPGGGPNLDVIGALQDCGTRFVLAHGETAACIMAAVHGHLTGRPSVAVVTRGPGAASAVNGAAQATLDRHPLILVTDTVPATSADRVPHQRLAQTAMLAPASKRSVTLGTDADHGALARLLDDACAYPAGTVHLDYDASTRGLHEPHPTGASQLSSGDTETSTDRDEGAIATARELITSALRPVVIVGLGALPRHQSDEDDEQRNDHHRLVEALERFGAPVLTTYQSIGVLPTDHRQWAGLFTNGASERPLLEESDLIVTIGLDMVEPIPAPWTYDSPVVSLAPAATTDPYLPAAVEVVGQPVALAEALLPERPDDDSEDRWDPDAGAGQREAVRAALQDGGSIGGGRLGPLEVVAAAARRLPESATTTVDAGAHFLAIMPFWPVLDPKRLLISNGLATMGYAVPAAIGAALARPDEPVLCLVGDGGLGMTLAELETMARLQLPITVLVFNDSALSLIEIKQQAEHGGREVVGYQPSDFAAVAAGMGLEGRRVRTVDELDVALSKSWDRPRVLDATIDPAPYRHLMSVTRG